MLSDLFRNVPYGLFPKACKTDDANDQRSDFGNGEGPPNRFELARKRKQVRRREQNNKLACKGNDHRKYAFSKGLKDCRKHDAEAGNGEAETDGSEGGYAEREEVGACFVRFEKAE